MARPNRSTMAEYECVVYEGCVIHVPHPNGNGTVEKLFRINDGERADDECKIQVPRGTIVCQHFEPLNDEAWEDRDAQIKDPSKFIKTEEDLMQMAEIMVKKGFFRTKQEAKDAIQEDCDYIATSEDTERELLIKKLANLGKDDKETRKLLVEKYLDGSDVTYFRGANPEKLAELVVDNGLYEDN